MKAIEIAYWLWLAQRQGISAREKKVLLSRLGSARDIFLAEEEVFAPMGLSEKALVSIQDKNLDPAANIILACRRKGIQILTYQEECYPPMLREIADSPFVLYALGKVPDWSAFTGIGIVGTRKATASALEKAKKIAYDLCKQGVHVVSGMAAGIDTFATAGALDAGCTAIGVLGCGVDIEYPAQNRALYARMKRDGCLLSEYPPGTQPQKWTFPERNRIISALSQATLVVEAPEKSGALITARDALRQGKRLFAMPGPKDFVSCAGSNALLEQGALKAETAEDILCHLSGFSKKEVDKKPDTTYHGAGEETILALLANGPMLRDDVIAASGLGTSRALSEITRLELQGKLCRLDASRITLK